MTIDPSDYIANDAPRDGAPQGVLLSAWAAAAPDRPAFTFAGRTLSYAEMDAAANRMARRMMQMGVTQGDRVVVAMPNRPAFAQAVYAAWKLGATPCSVSWRLAAEEFNAVVALAGPRVIAGTAALPATPVPLLDVDDPAMQGLPGEPLPPAIATPGKILTSGGSTGQPKLIIDPRPSVWGPDKANHYRPPGSVILSAGPMYHTAPFAYASIALGEGSHVICMERFDAEEWLRLAHRHRVTAAAIVPTMMSRIAKLPPAVTAAADLSSFRFLMHSSAPCPPDVKRWWLDKVEPASLLEVYGGAERIGATLIDGEEWLRHPGSVGKAPPGDAIVILGEDHRPLPPGEIGEIHFRRADGPGKTYSYLGSDTRIKGDLDSFGDLGWLDEEGYLYLADRRTDMFVVGGVNIYPAEIEIAIETLPGVLCGAVIGLPDADLGNRIHAIVELAADTPEPEDGLAFLAPATERLARFKRPHSVEFTRDRIRDDAGKVRRGALRAERINGSESAGTQEEPYSAERLPMARSAADYQLAALNGAIPPAPAWFERAMAQQPERRAIDVDGAPIETLIWGERGKPGLLLMHGSRANADWWSFIAPLLMRDFRVAAFSMSGMGRSGRRARYSVRQFAREAARVAEAAGLCAGPDRPIIAAHSFGGYGALQATLDQPERFGGVILIDSIMRDLDGAQAWRAVQPESQRVYPTLEAAIARFRLVPARASEAVWALDAIARSSVVHDAALGGWTWRFDSEYFAKLERENLSGLRGVTAPVAIIRGEESELMDPATRAHVAAAFGDDIPDIVIPDAGHHIMADQPLALAAALRTLLAAWPGDRKPRRSVLGRTEPAPY